MKLEPLEHDTVKGYTNKITAADLQIFMVKQNGEMRGVCENCDTKDNVQLFRWCCNRAKINVF
jgi:hypothetical protein